MAAPTNADYVKKVLANSEPSTHGTSPTSNDVGVSVAIGGEADITILVRTRGFSPAHPINSDGLLLVNQALNRGSKWPFLITSQAS